MNKEMLRKLIDENIEKYLKYQDKYAVSIKTEIKFKILRSLHKGKRMLNPNDKYHLLCYSPCRRIFQMMQYTGDKEITSWAEKMINHAFRSAYILHGETGISGTKFLDVIEVGLFLRNMNLLKSMAILSSKATFEHEENMDRQYRQMICTIIENDEGTLQDTLAMFKIDRDNMEEEDIVFVTNDHSIFTAIFQKNPDQFADRMEVRKNLLEPSDEENFHHDQYLVILENLMDLRVNYSQWIEKEINPTSISLNLPEDLMKYLNTP